jgi:hypothetical protein
MPNLSYKSWTFTIRPRNGAPEQFDDKIVKYLSKQHGAFLCSEMEDEARHLHGQVFFEEPRDKGTFNKSLERICASHISDWDAAQNIVLRRGTKIAYNDDFICNYLAKEDNILFNNVPQATSEFYPSKEEQQKVQDKSHAVDKKYHQWSVDFKEWNEEDKPVTIENVAKFLAHMIYDVKKYPVIVEKRKRIEHTNNLFHYLNPNKNSYFEFISEKKKLEIVNKNINNLENLEEISDDY